MKSNTRKWRSKPPPTALKGVFKMAVKITKPSTNLYKLFAEIAEGEFFLFADDLYLKIAPHTENENSFLLAQAGFSTFDDEEEVIPVDVEIIVKL